MDDEFEWLRYKPELGLPSLVEFLALLGIAVCLIFAAHMIRRIWERNNELVPVPVAFLMNLAMYLTYFFVASKLYDRMPPDSKTNFLLWSVIALALPAIYYGRIIVNSCATRVIDHISPFNMRIEEPSEFAEARKLALRRDIDGAVRRYRAYLENTDAALFEAARLLNSEDRYAEAAALFQDIADRFYSNRPVWAEATFHLAKLRESRLHQAGDAVGLLQGILERTPDSRFGKLAEVELARIEAMHGAGANFTPPDDSDDDPFFDKDQPEGIPVGRANGRYRNIVEDIPVPAVDPFYIPPVPVISAGSENSSDQNGHAEKSSREAADVPVQNGGVPAKNPSAGT